jgi:single-strand DNA-binding protein
MNRVVLMGRLTRDPEVRYSNNSEQPLAIARFSLAVDRRFNRNNSDGQTADFINCVSFGKTAEFAEKYLHKGTKVCLDGRIQTGSYTNKEGQKVYTTEVVAENVEFAESKNAGGNGGDYAGASQSSVGAEEGFMNLPPGIDDEIPFSKPK